MSPRALTPSPKLGARFETALAQALYVHRTDTRKGKRTPYVSHLLGVCSLVLQHGGSEDEAIGALLHDTLEDHPELVTPASLRKRYGAKVLAIVQGCTDTPADYKGGAKPA
jgi:(p)ppGpp synthase/HD superfamily hydrolase